MVSRHNVDSSSALTTESRISPFRRLLALLREDRKDLLILIAYTVLSGMLTLAVPLAAQALVNAIAAGVFLQPLAVLAALLFAGMLFAGVLRASQFYIVETIQQRTFARIALKLAAQTPFVKSLAWRTDYPPEALNRFFDVVKVQKTLSKLLLDGPAALLQILVGLILMAIYSPILLGFDLFILLFIVFIAFILGRNGVHTSMGESVEKYRVAGWLQELARCQASFKIDGARAHLFQKSDDGVVAYLHARRSHFRILFRQVVANYFFQALASASLLGLGGWLVIHGQLTLGQLVASELVILILLAAMDKLVAMFQDWYDLLTAVEKIAHVTELPLERRSGTPLPVASQGVSVACRNVCFAYDRDPPLFQGLTFSISAGERVSVAGASGSGKSTLAALLCGLIEPKTGLVEIQGLDVRQADLESLREAVALVGKDEEIFDGTLEENVTMGRASISQPDLRWALNITGLLEAVAELPDGLQTRLAAAGRNVSTGQARRILLARAIAGRPRLLILDEAFTGLDEKSRRLILEALFAPENDWTILILSQDAQAVMSAPRALTLAGGVIAESGAPLALVQQEGSLLASLFPDFAERLLRRGA